MATSATSRPFATAVWALCTLGMVLLNLVFDTGRASLCIGYPRDFLGSIGFVLAPVAVAGLYCLLRGQRSWYRFFRAATLLSLTVLIYLMSTTNYIDKMQFCVEVEPLSTPS